MQGDFNNAPQSNDKITIGHWPQQHLAALSLAQAETWPIEELHDT